MSRELINTYLLTFLSFDKGETWYDVTPFVADDQSITQRAMNDNFMSAQNECSFTLYYDEEIYNLLRAQEEDVLIIVTNNDEPSLGFRSLASFNLGSAERLFTGHFPVGFDRAYNGIVENQRIQVSATDSLDMLDVPTGDVVFLYNPVVVSEREGPFQICNPDIPTYSIVHRLATIAGFGDRVNGVVKILDYIDDVMAIAPDYEDVTVLEMLDKLLHEYGYVLRMDAQDDIRPTPWMYDNTSTIMCTFTDANTRDTFKETRTPRQFIGAELTYFERGLKTYALLFRDAELPYTDTGAFGGYQVNAGEYYPPKTNVLDDNGDRVKVFQEYTDDGILYWTNKAVVNNLEINRHAVDSNFTNIVATNNTFVEYKTDNELLAPDISITYNKKAEIRFRNNGLVPYLIYYLRVMGDIIYKKSKSVLKSYTGEIERKLYKYEAMFISSDVKAKRYMKRFAPQITKGVSHFMIESDTSCPPGAIVRVQLEDGTDVYGIVISKTRDSSIDGYRYDVKRFELVDADITTQVSNATPTGANNLTPTRVARYVGKHSTIPPMEEGDWMLAAVDITV